MRALFLDFDGVTHPVGGAPGYTLPFEWLPVLTGLLSSAPDVRLVIHSSWVERYSFDELREFLGPLADRTIGAVGLGRKADAIEAFLLAHPEIDSWLVVDDCPSEFPRAHFKSLVACDSELGLSDPAVQSQISRWLSAQR